MKPSPLGLAYLGFALLGSAVLGAYLYDRARPSPAADGTSPRVAAATANPASAEPPLAGGPPVPTRRPDVRLQGLDGKPHALSEWDGKSLIVNFWATWCAPCRREIPLLNRIHREYASKGFEVVGIAVDFVDDVKAYTKTFPLDYPLLIGEDDGLAAARAFGVDALAFPFTAFTDAEGRIVTVHLGELQPAQLEAILGVVADVNGGRLAPAAARGAVERALAALPPADHGTRQDP